MSNHTSDFFYHHGVVRLELLHTGETVNAWSHAEACENELALCEQTLPIRGSSTRQCAVPHCRVRLGEAGLVWRLLLQFLLKAFF